MSLNYAFDRFLFSLDYFKNAYQFGLIPFELWIQMESFQAHMLHHCCVIVEYSTNGHTQKKSQFRRKIRRKRGKR